MLTTYELETGNIGFIEMKPNFFKSRILERINELEIIYGDVVYGRKHDYFKLPDGKWTELGIFSQLKEEDVKEVMPKYGLENKKFRSFKDHFTNPYFFWCETALEAIHSLAQHLGFNSVNNAIHPSDLGEISLSHYLKLEEEWQEAQSKVKQYFVVFKPKQ